jgi:hypothetical protein
MIRVLLAALAVAVHGVALAQPLVPLQLQCSGRAPEWRLEAGPDAALLVRPDARPAEEVFRGTLLRLVSPTWDGAAWRGAAGGLPGRTLSAVVRREACTDPSAGGASTDARGAVVPPDGPPLAGCCRAVFGFDLARAPLADPSRKPATDWSRALSTLAGAVRACVIDSGVNVATVASARTLDTGGATVRLLDTNGAVHDCEVDGSRKRVVATRAAAPAAELRPSAESPVLWPARERPPVLDCGRVERVVERGALFGWLQYGPC